VHTNRATNKSNQERTNLMAYNDLLIPINDYHN